MSKVERFALKFTKLYILLFVWLLITCSWIFSLRCNQEIFQAPTMQWGTLWRLLTKLKLWCWQLYYSWNKCYAYSHNIYKQHNVLIPVNRYLPFNLQGRQIALAEYSAFVKKDQLTATANQTSMNSFWSKQKTALRHFLILEQDLRCHLVAYLSYWSHAFTNVFELSVGLYDYLFDLIRLLQLLINNE